MLPPGLNTPREVTLHYDDIYEALVKSGNARPFLYPWAGLGAFAIIAYLLVDHRQNALLRRLRFPIFIIFAASEIWVIQTHRARNPAAAFGVGLLSAWGVAWVSTLMVVNDCQTDFTRIERNTSHAGAIHGNEHPQNGSTSNGSLSDRTSDTTKPDESYQEATNTVTGSYYWQHYPTSLLCRIEWIADVFCSFRGVGWNWQTTTVPPAPKFVQLALSGKIEEVQTEPCSVSRVGIRRFTDRKSLLQSTFANLIAGYLILDAVKVLMHNDAYFWGYTDAPGPSYLPDLLKASHTFVKSYRLLISMTAIYTALWEIFKLGPLFFCGILGPRWLGVRGEPWMNPANMFGSYSNVLSDGLAGWWGGWWHQVFRVAFERHSKKLLELLRIDKRSQKGKLIGLFTAFLMSGCLHACGSYTQLGDNRPLMGPFRFFLLQPFGIIFQMLAGELASEVGLSQRTPKICKQVANFIFTHVWLYYTAPLLVDDFAQGGVWLFEPLAISPLRAMGLGAKDDTWFCWWDGIVFWRSGKHWWDTGIAI